MDLKFSVLVSLHLQVHSWTRVEDVLSGLGEEAIHLLYLLEEQVAAPGETWEGWRWAQGKGRSQTGSPAVFLNS